MKTLSILFLLLWSSLSFAQYDDLGDLRANPYSSRSLDNPYGVGSPYKSDGLMNRYSRYGSPYSNDSWRNPYASNPPRTSYGEFSTNRYRRDSMSNEFGRYGSRYSTDSLSNPYGVGNRYYRSPLYVYPGRN